MHRRARWPATTIMMNLVSNAFRHAPGNPVVVRMDADDETARLVVQDHGPGIPKDRRARIFERFETSSDRASSGLGLGLFITRQIVEAHRKSISVESEVGVGTTMVVELPRRCAEHGSDQESHREGSNGR